MNILINKLPHDLPEGASLADAVEALKPALPFAAAVNKIGRASCRERVCSTV